MVKNRGGLGKGLGALVKQDIQKEKKATLKVNIDSIDPNPNQPRKCFHEDALYTLMESIKIHGLIQPIILRKMGDRYEIVAGERRWRACKQLDFKEVDAIIKDYSTAETTEIALVENLQRQDLDPIEEAYAYKHLQDTFKLTQEEISGKIGRSRSHIANMMRLLRLAEKVKNELSAGEITIGQARPLLALETEALQEEALQYILEEELNARQVEILVKKLQAPEKTMKKEKPVESAEIRAWADKLKVSLGSNVKIKLSAKDGHSGKIEIPFTSETEFLRLMELFDEDMKSKKVSSTKKFVV